MLNIGAFRQSARKYARTVVDVLHPIRARVLRDGKVLIVQYLFAQLLVVKIKFVLLQILALVNPGILVSCVTSQLAFRSAKTEDLVVLLIHALVLMVGLIRTAPLQYVVRHVLMEANVLKIICANVL